MLTYLKIENLATIRELVLEPGPGFNVLTGETGAGKSVIVESLDLALGARARRELVRTGCAKGVVTAAFDLSLNEAAAGAVEALGLDRGEELLIVKREIAAGGRHRVLLNGEPATLSMLESLGPLLGEVHGQHENQELLRPAAHAAFVDAFAGLGARVGEVRELHAELTAAVEELERIETLERERAQRADLLSYQLAEIEEARLAPAPAEGEQDEDSALARDHERAARAEELADSLAEAARLLADEDDAAAARIARASRVLEPVAGLAEGLADCLPELEEARIRVEECARTIASAQADAERDPAQLAALDERLRLLERLKRKYGPELGHVREHARRAAEELEELGGLDERREELRRRRDDCARRLSSAAGELSKKRRSAGRRLAARVAEELVRLDMPGARLGLEQELVPEASSPVVVGGRRVACGPSGVDRLQLLFSANEGEEPRPLARIASGGEISRVMLVLKGLITGGAGGRCWVFDEVDAGVGGEAALHVAERLAGLARGGAQVFCVTHLPQVAARADHHASVRKSREGGRTETRSRRLDTAERVAELARMLSGRDSRVARRHAEELLAAAEGAS